MWRRSPYKTVLLSTKVWYHEAEHFWLNVSVETGRRIIRLHLISLRPCVLYPWYFEFEYNLYVAHMQKCDEQPWNNTIAGETSVLCFELSRFKRSWSRRAQPQGKAQTWRPLWRSISITMLGRDHAYHSKSNRNNSFKDKTLSQIITEVKIISACDP